MKKRILSKLNLPSLLIIGLIGGLFCLGMTISSEVHAQPEPGSLLETTSININGEEWTFRTPPPPASQRYVISSHPRLLLTQANLPRMREKLADPVYANDMNELKNAADGGDAMANAFLYQLEGDINRGTVAKNWLLSGSFGDVPGLERAAEWFEPVLVFDWVMPLLSSAEKKDAFDLVKSNFGYDPQTPIAWGRTLYWNDVWARHPELQYPILALAIAGDGIDDVWAQEVLDLAYNDSPLVLLGPYGVAKGAGFLDMLATISLDDGGGAQAGSYEFLGSGYYTMFLHAFMPLGAWETATNQPMWARKPFL